MTRKSKKNELDKSHRLSLAELAAHDDACTDVMVDKAYYRAQIRKNKSKYTPLRGIKEDEVPQIILHKIIVGKDLVAAEKALLQLVGVKRYMSTLKGRAVKDNFINHFRKYIAIYQTECPWEVSTTNRYTITTFEAAVTARHRIKQNQTIPYLVGTLVPMTAEESAELDVTNRNFSIVLTGRKKNSSIFLGPARFANHDCHANARLVPKGGDSMEVTAIKNIEPGDEITVSYGDDYFGPNNADCLCHTCELHVRNGWSATPREEIDDDEAEEEPVKRTSASPQATRTATTEPSISWQRPRMSDGKFTKSSPGKKPKITSPSKLHQSWTPPPTSESEENDPDTIVVDVSRHWLNDDPPAVSPSPSELQPTTESSRKRKRGALSPASRKRTRTSNVNPSLNLVPEEHNFALPSPLSMSSSLSDLEQEKDSNTVTVKIETTETTRIETDASDLSVPLVIKEEPERWPFKKEPSDDVPIVHEPQTLTTLKTTQISRTDPTVVPSIEPVPVSTTSTLTIHPLSPNHRTPGDWYLTRKLLAQPHDRWVQCHNVTCKSFFLQHNGYHTRRECPRCERHSMLYGFCWPKTDPDRRKILERGTSQRERHDPALYSAYRRQGKQGKGTWVEGGGDEEERTMDHRTVHRFVLPEDEKAVTKKGLLKMAEVARQRKEHFEMSFGRDGSFRRTGSEALHDREGSGSGLEDAEGRRRSNRIVQVRVYANV